MLTAPRPQPISLTLDLQSLYPPSLLAATPFPAFMKWYTTFSRDPIILGAMSPDPAWDWLRCFLKMEAFVQLPSFFIGAYGLYKSEQRAVLPVLANAWVELTGWADDKRVYRASRWVYSRPVHSITSSTR